MRDASPPAWNRCRRSSIGGWPSPPPPEGEENSLAQRMRSMRPLDTSIKVEDIHTYYGKSHILHGVCLEVGRGEVVGLLGRNGVGKSTTLKAIIGLVHPSQGSVRFEGRSIAHLPAHRLAQLGIGYVPEDRR